MSPHSVDGAVPRRADHLHQGHAPRPNAARERVRQLGELFSAQIQQSMAQSLAGLSASGEDDDAGGEGEDFGGFGDLGATLGATAVGGTGAVRAGAGTEAGLAQQLLAAATVVTGSQPVDAAGPPPGSRDVRANARIVAQVAREQGVDPVAAVAMMLVESGGDAGAVGDGGTSFGLFQLHQGGMLTSAGLTPQQAYDPRTNATVSLRALAHEARKGPNRSPGEIAAASQRPFDPAGYARKVDAAMERARALLA